MRKSQAKKLPLAPDAKYNDILVTRFVNNLMWQGKKNTAFGLFYDAIDRVSKQSNENGPNPFSPILPVSLLRKWCPQFTPFSPTPDHPDYVRKPEDTVRKIVGRCEQGLKVSADHSEVSVFVGDRHRNDSDCESS